MSDLINRGAVRSAIARNEILDDLNFVEATDSFGPVRLYLKKPHLFRRNGCWYCRWGTDHARGATPQEALKDILTFRSVLYG